MNAARQLMEKRLRTIQKAVRHHYLPPALAGAVADKIVCRCLCVEARRSETA